MISPDSDLYRAHPDWCLHVPNRYRTQQRNQLILDMSRQEIQDYLIDTISGLLRGGAIDYIKWDMNRNFDEVGSAALPPEDMKSLHVRYMLGLYRVLDTLTSRFPDVLFESCSGGGGRFDPGMLAYLDQRRYRRRGARGHSMGHQPCLSCLRHQRPCERGAQPSGGPRYHHEVPRGRGPGRQHGL